MNEVRKRPNCNVSLVGLGSFALVKYVVLILISIILVSGPSLRW